MTQADSEQKLTTADPLQTPVQFVPNVGPQRAQLLAKLGIRTALDLLLHIPHSVNDFTDVRTVPKLQPELEQSVHGTVVDRDARRLKHNRTLVGILLDCDGHFVRGIWFNQPWMLHKFQCGDHVVFSGKPKRSAGRWEFSSPRVHWLADSDDLETATGVLPRYALTEGITMEQMRRMAASALEGFAEYLVDLLPEYFRKHHRLPELQTAMRWLHSPTSSTEFQAGRERIVLDDLLEFQLGLALRRRMLRDNSRAFSIRTSAKIDARIRRLFSFRFTAGQDASVQEIVSDLSGSKPMHRLLQADVGAGKTAIAVYAMLTAVAAGYQVALMAPTEVLATQHWQTLEELLSHSRVRRGFLIGGLPAAERRSLLAGIESGEVQIVVGTQAVIQESVQFRSLALAIIDEQHRFGVRQRAQFSGVDETGRQYKPHVLVMTATPIPRSLCLTRFGDLDVSTIRELPPGRQSVVTSRVSTEPETRRVWSFIRQEVRKGRQAYVVCPRVEGADSEDDAAAEVAFRQLSQNELTGLRVDLMHGRMDRERRREVMDQFTEHQSDVLVSTTVIEVGVNIPNATLMVIIQAERFGLAQLHQLRGRISRGRHQGYCFMLSEANAPDAVERLKAMEDSSDGFVLAEKDAEIRGPGDVLGTRQSGSLPLRVANPVRDIRTLQIARRMAQDLVRTGDFDSPEYAALKTVVLDRFSEVLELQQTG